MAKKYDFRDPVQDYSNHEGESYGRYEILKLEDFNSEGKRRYAVKCTVCGKIIHGLTITDVKRGANLKCIHDRLGKYKAKWAHQQLRMKYTAMIDRCYNENCSGYYNYGDRGITVCDEWLNSPQAFNDWAIKNGFRVGLSIDRIDNNKGYSPDNCRWVSNHFNMIHRRVVNWLKVDGVDNTLADWSRLFGYSRQFFYDYYKKHGKKATKNFIREHIDAKRRLISERPRHKFNINGKEMTVDQTTQYLGLRKTHLGHFIRKYGIDEARKYVSQLVDNKVKNGSLIIRLGGR